MKQIRDLIVRLNRIAKLNDDKFRYQIVIDETDFTFVCEETADEHEFFSVAFEELDDINVTNAQLVDACANWSYEF